MKFVFLLAPSAVRAHSLRRSSRRCVLALASLLLLLAGCVSKGLPPVADRSPVANPAARSYVVRAGDTLYSIAWRHDRDFRQLARLNSIAPPFRIVPGQRLRLQGEVRAQVPANRPPAVAASKAPNKTPTTKPAPKNATTPKLAGPQSWVWPVPGQPTKRFGQAGNKGIDFGVTGASSIRATAGGEVVYAGAGLGGYRYLVIVKHSERYLSAYGFDATLRVLEGQQIKGNAILADIPSESAVQSLHFELRKDGIPINPTGVIGR